MKTPASNLSWTMSHSSHQAVNGMPSHALDLVADQVLVEREFLLDRFSLRAQFDWKIARQSMYGEDLAGETGRGVLTVFRSPAERIFTRERVIDFLAHLRKKAASELGTRHASTPQVWVFRKGRHAWVERDASLAPCRYMYFLGPRRGGTPMTSAIQTREAILPWLPWLTRTRTLNVTLGSNDLIVFRSTAVQSVQYRPNSVELQDQTVVLSGWLW